MEASLSGLVASLPPRNGCGSSLEGLVEGRGKKKKSKSRNIKRAIFLSHKIIIL
jgi:hypothetical protein